MREEGGGERRPLRGYRSALNTAAPLRPRPGQTLGHNRAAKRRRNATAPLPRPPQRWVALAAIGIEAEHAFTHSGATHGHSSLHRARRCLPLRGGIAVAIPAAGRRVGARTNERGGARRRAVLQD